jgi:hypothetical protein
MVACYLIDVPGKGFEPLFVPPKGTVLPLDDPGICAVTIQKILNFRKEKRPQGGEVSGVSP